MKKGSVKEGDSNQSTPYGKSQYTRSTKKHWPGEGKVADLKQQEDFIKWCMYDEHFNKWLKAYNTKSTSTEVMTGVITTYKVNKDAVKLYIEQTGIFPPEYDQEDVISHTVNVKEPKLIK